MPIILEDMVLTNILINYIFIIIAIDRNKPILL